jgi:hypothetical protein
MWIEKYYIIVSDLEEFYFEFNFDNSSLLYDDAFIAIGVQYLSIQETHPYKPDPTSDTTILLTDWTSICKLFFLWLINNSYFASEMNKWLKRHFLMIVFYTWTDTEAVNGLFCEIPFSLNGIENYFCAADEYMFGNEDIQCETINGLSNCNLGTYFLNWQDWIKIYERVNI